ncbi:hypothetical protein TR2A62_0290 [Thalassobium sp. R2A62]|nr:hypothetical protein TR2A62_0290 [Thalassobium sp. R2A62]
MAQALICFKTKIKRWIVILNFCDSSVGTLCMNRAAPCLLVMTVSYAI